MRVLQWEKGKPDEIENETVYYSLSDQIGSNQLELNEKGEVVSYESYYPYGGTAVWATKNQVEANYKYQRYSGKERDATGLYYYGYRYYIPWLGRWVNADPSGIAEGLNLFQMVNNNPIAFYDPDGRAPYTGPVKKSGKGAGQPTFKGLYPSIEADENGVEYRPITSIFGFKDPSKTREVNVRVYDNSEDSYNSTGVRLFTGPTKAKRLVVSSHGTFHPEISSEIKLTPDLPIIEFLGPHGASLWSEDLDYPNVYADIDENSVGIYTKHAYSHFQKYGMYGLTGSNEKGKVMNYIVSKLETTPYDNPALQSVMAHNAEYTAWIVNRTREVKEPVDFLTITKDRRGDFIMIRDFLEFAKAREYHQITLNHCRTNQTVPEFLLPSYSLTSDEGEKLPEPYIIEW